MKLIWGVPRLVVLGALTTALGCATAHDAPSNDAPEAGANGVPLAPYDTEPCHHVSGGPPSAFTVASSLGRAHALARYFGATYDAIATDALLTKVLEQHAPSDPATAKHYAKAIGACAAPAGLAMLPSASVKVDDDIAIVVPGTGDLPALPAKVKAIALDVRNLVDTPSGRDALDRALRAIIDGDLEPLLREERICNGQPTESSAEAKYGLYTCEVTQTPAPPLHGTGPAAPIAVLTAPRLTPLAASAVALLRARRGAFLIGESVPTLIAESTWTSMAAEGLAIRTHRLLLSATEPLPDVLEADERTSDPNAALARIDWKAERPPLEGEVTRAPIGEGKPPGRRSAPMETLGAARAALVTAYGATRTFFPYFDVVGDGIDARLDETLGMLGSHPTYQDTWMALMRFTQVLEDGHSGAYPPEVRAPAGASRSYPPIGLVAVGDQLVVGRSVTDAIAPGEVVVAIDGTSAKTKLEARKRLTSGSPHMVHALSAALVLWDAKAKTVTVEQTSGGARRTVALQPSAAFVSTLDLFERPFGPLAAHGASDIFYVSVSAPTTGATRTAADLAKIQQGIDASTGGVVLDMRGYPDTIGHDVLGYLIDGDSAGPKMEMLLVGPESRQSMVVPDVHLSDWTSVARGYAGKLVVLTGPYTQSNAEFCIDFIRSKPRAKLVGEATSGADGNITDVVLPGGASISFTGMVVQKRDGSVFHAHGHTPDVVVAPSIADLRDGKDAVLLRAIAELRASP